MWNLSSVFHSFLFGPRTGLPFLSVHCALRLSHCQLLRCRRGAGQVSHCLLWQAALPTGGRAGLPVPCSSSSWTRLLPSVSALTGERSVSDTSDFWAQTQKGPALLPCRLRKRALGTNAAQVRRPRSRPVFGLLSGSDTLILICSFGQESVWGCDGRVHGVQLGLSCWNSSGCVGPHADQGGSVATVSAATGSTATPVVDSGAVTATATWTHCETGLDQDCGDVGIPHPTSPQSVSHGGMTAFGVLSFRAGWWPPWCCPSCARKVIGEGIGEGIGEPFWGWSLARRRLSGFYTVTHG